MAPKVVAVLEPVLVAMGADSDPESWVAWGDDPGMRYAVLAPTVAGLIVAHVRVNQPGEGPRASAKLVRWPRVQFGELAIETQAGRRFLSFQVEGQILRGVDDEADRIGRFALDLLAAAEGRPAGGDARGRRRGTGGRRVTTTKAAARPTTKKPAASPRTSRSRA
jgi:hypothetical protein